MQAGWLRTFNNRALTRHSSDAFFLNEMNLREELGQSRSVRVGSVGVPRFCLAGHRGEHEGHGGGAGGLEGVFGAVVVFGVVLGLAGGGLAA